MKYSSVTDVPIHVFIRKLLKHFVKIAKNKLWMEIYWG